MYYSLIRTLFLCVSVSNQSSVSLFLPKLFINIDLLSRRLSSVISVGLGESTSRKLTENSALDLMEISGAININSLCMGDIDKIYTFVMGLGRKMNSVFRR